MVVRTISEFQEVLFLSETLNKITVKGNHFAVLSGAGFEAVGMADSIQSDDFHMELATLDDETRESIAQVLCKKRLDSYVTLSNPFDINPAADDEAHAVITRILARDKGVDALVVSLDPLSPAMRTLDETTDPNYDMHHKDSIKNRLIRLVNECDTPLVAVVDGGRRYDPLRNSLIASNIPVFTVCDRAIAALSLYIQGRLTADAIRSAESNRKTAGTGHLTD
jgi:acyl-CoA synthetase (NDP forming)